MRELLRHEQARGRRSGTAVAAHAVAPSISAAANIIGLASNDLAPDSGLLECAPPTVAATSYAPSAAYGRVTGAKRMADWHSSSECPMPPEPPKMPRLNSSTSIILHDIDSIWPGVAPQLAAVPVVAPIPPAIASAYGISAHGASARHCASVSMQSRQRDETDGRHLPLIS